MAVNPCCMPLQKGVMILAVIDIIFSIIDLLVAILDLLFLTVENQIKDDQIYLKGETTNLDSSESHIAKAMAGILIITAILGVLLSLRLYFGAKKRDIRNCRIWLIIKLILFFLGLLSLIVNSTAGRETNYNLAVTIFTLSYRTYMMYCVYCFIQEMKINTSRAGFQARLASAKGPSDS